MTQTHKVYESQNGKAVYIGDVTAPDYETAKAFGLTQGLKEQDFMLIRNYESENARYKVDEQEYTDANGEPFDPEQLGYDCDIAEQRYIMIPSKAEGTLQMLIKAASNLHAASIDEYISEQAQDQAYLDYHSTVEEIAKELTKMTGGQIDGLTAKRMAHFKRNEIKQLLARTK
ncbi:MAG: hypothetical protein LBQ15_03525 [Clostridium sp.]|jgi:hypothetical protein|nr:hypothetical protein [Clostridium sp.]